MFLVKDALKICSKFTVEHPFWSVISIKLQSKFIESTLRHGCSQKKSMYIFRTRFTKNTSGRLLLKIVTGFYPIPIFPKNLHYLYLINKFHIITVHFEHTHKHTDLRFLLINWTSICLFRMDITVLIYKRNSFVFHIR